MKEVIILTIEPHHRNEILELFEEYEPGLDFIHKIKSKDNPEQIIFIKPANPQLLGSIRQKSETGICSIEVVKNKKNLKLEGLAREITSIAAIISTIVGTLSILDVFSSVSGGGSGSGRPPHE